MPPRFSIIIPVLHEEAVITATVDHLGEFLRNERFEGEIIVVDGDTEGKTIGAVTGSGSAIKTAVGIRGRGSQMNEGAALAEGDILLFLHADTRLPPGAFSLVEAALRKPGCRAGAFDLAIDSERPVFRIIETVASFRSRLTRIPYGDQAHFFRRKYFREIGGYAKIPLMEDVEIMRRIKKRKEKIVIVKKAVSTSARRWEKEGVLTCTLRNWLLIILYLCGLSPDYLSRFYK